MSDEMTQDRIAPTGRDALELRQLIRLVSKELGVIAQERTATTFDLNETDLARVEDRICAQMRKKSPIDGKPIDQLSMADLELAFSLAALRAAEENRAIVP